MARLIVALLWLSSALFAAGQAPVTEEFKTAGACARCHVISVVEWSMSHHRQAGTTCTSCHGESRGHIVDERNNIKPDRIPRNAAVAGLCATCHAGGCPKTKNAVSCQTCHHVHALVDPRRQATVKDERLDRTAREWQEAARHMSEGEHLIVLRQWRAARDEYRLALGAKPGDPHARERIAFCERQLHPKMPGFENQSERSDTATGLPNEVRVAGQGIEMILVPEGDADLGDEQFAGTTPVHTVHVSAFYIGKFEVTQAQWRAVMGVNPSAHQGPRYPDAERMPVEQVSWYDARQFIHRLNAAVAGGGFRLPTEAEWEFAARRGAARRQELAQAAWYDAPDQSFAPGKVGSRRPNQLGIFDMQGNVWEWCSSLARPYPYDANDGREFTEDGGLRVLRGGSYADGADLLDPAMRHQERPSRRLPWNGLRIARSVPNPVQEVER